MYVSSVRALPLAKGSTFKSLHVFICSCDEYIGVYLRELLFETVSSHVKGLTLERIKVFLAFSVLSSLQPIVESSFYSIFFF